MEDIFSQFGDIFGGHFGGGGFRTSSSTGGGRRVNRGSDIRIEVKLSLEEIATGVTKKLKISKTIACDKCGGTGAKDAGSYATCSSCKGTGYVTRVENTFFWPHADAGCLPDVRRHGQSDHRIVRQVQGRGYGARRRGRRDPDSGRSGRGMVLTVSGRAMPPVAAV